MPDKKNKIRTPQQLQEEEGERMREARKERGLRLEDFAAGAGVSPPTVSRWETGMYPIPEMGLVALESRMGLNPSWIRLGQLPMWIQASTQRRAQDPLPALEIVSLAKDRNHGARALLGGHDLLVVTRPTRGHEAGELWLAKTSRGLAVGKLLPDRQGALYLYAPDNDAPETRGHFPPVLVQAKDLIGKAWGYVQSLEA